MCRASMQAAEAGARRYWTLYSVSLSTALAEGVRFDRSGQARGMRGIARMRVGQLDRDSERRLCHGSLEVSPFVIGN